MSAPRVIFLSAPVRKISPSWRGNRPSMSNFLAIIQSQFGKDRGAKRVADEIEEVRRGLPVKIVENCAKNPASAENRLFALNRLVAVNQLKTRSRKIRGGEEERAANEAVDELVSMMIHRGDTLTFRFRYRSKNRSTLAENRCSSRQRELFPHVSASVFPCSNVARFSLARISNICREPRQTRD